MVDSIDGEHMHFHDVEIWQTSGVWYGTCDEEQPDDYKFICKANRLGGKLCSHLAKCVVDMQELIEPEPEPPTDPTKDATDVFG